MADFKGAEIGRYKVSSKIGEGGIAVVYKATDTHLDTDVAIKFLELEKLSTNASTTILKRFKIEAQKMAQLSHASIVRVTDFGEFEGTPYLVMPFMSGGSLKNKIGKPIPWREALILLRPIAEALAYTHKKNLIHRDIKPSNILINDSGQSMLSDFGIVKILESEETMDLTGTSMGIGTAEYMAPEQADSLNVDARVDVYSMGVVLFELISGKKPFPTDKTDTPVSIMIKHARDPLPPIQDIVHRLPEDVVALIEKALEKEPINRFQEMENFLDAMNKCLGFALIPTSPIGSNENGHSNFRKRIRESANKVTIWFNKLSNPLKIGISLLSIAVIGLGIFLPRLINPDNPETITEELLTTQEITSNPISTAEIPTPTPEVEPVIACEFIDKELINSEWKEVLCQTFSEGTTLEGWDVNEVNERIAVINTEVYKEHLGVRVALKQDSSNNVTTPVKDLRDFMMSVEGRLSGYSGNPYHQWGLALKVSETDYYVFKIDAKQSFSFILVRGNEKSNLTNTKFYSGINPIDQTNRLTVIVDNYNFQFYINGELVEEIRDNRLLAGDVGVYLGMYGSGTLDWEFDNFVIYQP